jgi:arylsulfatase A-like enzyme
MSRGFVVVIGAVLKSKCETIKHSTSSRKVKRPLLFLIALSIWLAPLLRAAEKPNVLRLIVDDLNTLLLGDWNRYAGKVVAPNITRLAESAVNVTRCYAPSPKCSPSRLAFMTGSYAHRAGTTKVIYPRDRIGINPAEITTAELLKQAGYTCGIVGKWHLGDWEPFHPLNHGFDYFKGAWHVAEDGGGNGRRGRGVHGEPHCPLGNLPEVRRDRARRGQRCARFPRGEQDPPLFSLPRQSRHALPLETERKVHRHLAAPEAKAKRSNQKKTRSRLI